MIEDGVEWVDYCVMSRHGSPWLYRTYNFLWKSQKLRWYCIEGIFRGAKIFAEPQCIEFLRVKSFWKRIFKIHLLTVIKREASYSLYQSCSQRGRLPSLWLWMHSLAACGLVSLVEVGWLTRDYRCTDSSRLNQERERAFGVW